MGSKLNVSSGFCLLWAACLLLLPLRWAMGVLLAVFIHEFAHFVAIYLLGGQVYAVNLEGNGAVMETAPQTAGKEATCALAGPLGSFSLLLISEYFPEAAVCGLVQGAYNLMPIYPLDGGRMMRCLFPQSICRWVEVLFLLLMTGLSLWTGIINPKFAIMLQTAVSIPLIRGKLTCKAA